MFTSLGRLIYIYICGQLYSIQIYRGGNVVDKIGAGDKSNEYNDTTAKITATTVHSVSVSRGDPKFLKCFLYFFIIKSGIITTRILTLQDYY